MKHPDPNSTTPRNGAGGAHTSWSMFGARGPCLNPEDRRSGGGGGGGTGGGDGSDGGGDGAGDGTGDDGGGDSGNGGGTDGKIVMSQAELDKLVGDRIARDRASRSKPGRQPQQQAASKTASTSTGTNNTDTGTASDAWRFDFEDAYEEVTEELGATPSKAIKRRLRDAFAAARPTDSHVWVKGWLTDLGVTGNANANTNTSNSITNNATGESSSKQGASVKQPPISDKGAANGGAREFDAISNPNELTKSDVERLYAKHGQQKADQMIGQMAVRWLSTVRLRIDRARK